MSSGRRKLCVWAMDAAALPWLFPSMRRYLQPSRTPRHPRTLRKELLRGSKQMLWAALHHRRVYLQTVY